MERKPRILFIEDDPNLAFVIKDNLIENGYKVDHFDNGEDGENAFCKTIRPLFIRYYVTQKDGFSVAETIRKKDQKTPIIFYLPKNNKRTKILVYALEPMIILPSRLILMNYCLGFKTK